MRHDRRIEPDGDCSPSTAPIPDGDSEFTYFRVLDAVTPYEYIKGVVRERIVDGYSDAQVFTRSEGWKNTAIPLLHRSGRTDNDLVEITSATARDLIAKLKAAWQR